MSIIRTRSALEMRLRTMPMNLCSDSEAESLMVEAASRIEELETIRDAARDLLSEIREHGTHQGWKTLANAMRKIGAWE